MITEEFLFYIWKTQGFNNQDLKTHDEQILQIIYPGTLNTDQGPDFSQAQIFLDDIKWIGSIEIHVKTSDWIKHNHSGDVHYNNVILHVVYEHDMKDLNQFPTLELKPRIDIHLLETYERFQNISHKIPCASFIEKVPSLVIKSALESVLVERLQQKTVHLEETYQYSRGDWEYLMINQIAKYLFGPVNAESIYQLVTPELLTLISKYNNQKLTIEALLFGSAGLLPDHHKHPYVQSLINEFRFLKHKHSLQSMPAHYWKFSRMRPQNFPSMRLAQLAALLFNRTHFLSTIEELQSIDELFHFFQIEVANYWKSHYTFEPSSQSAKELECHVSKIGRDTIDIICINAVIPVLFSYAQKLYKPALMHKMGTWLEEIPAENNKYTRLFIPYQIKANSAHDSQALLQLAKMYCLQKKCLDCKIGNAILRQSKKKWNVFLKKLLLFSFYHFHWSMESL